MIKNHGNFIKKINVNVSHDFIPPFTISIAICNN